MAGSGDKNADLVIIDSAPSRSEDRAGTPGSSESARIVSVELKKNSLTSVYRTNIVKCRTPDNREPTNEEIKACRPYLDKELERIDPRAILTLGVPATKVLFRGKAKINQFHGELIDMKPLTDTTRRDLIGMPTFHPGYTLRDPSKLPGFQNDIKRLAQTLRGEVQDQSVHWSIVRRGNLGEFIRAFTEASEFAFDLETSGLFPYDKTGYISAVCIALPERAWVIPGFMHPDFAKFGVGPWRRGDSLAELLRLLAKIQRQTKKKAYGWNAKFDNSWLHVYAGCRFHLDFDGMLAAHNLDENTANDLTANCREWLDVPEYDIPLNVKQGKSDNPMDNYFYCAQDGMYTFRIVKLMQKKLKKERTLRRLFYKLTMPAARAMSNIELRGLTIDRKRMEEIGLDLLSEKIQIKHRLDELAGREVNWNSPAQVSEVLYGDLGIKCVEFTKKKKPSTSETALLALMGTHEIIDLLFQYRERAKFISTYINGFQSYMVEDKLYVSYKLHGTVTGRYSSRIHSIPRDGSIRNLVTAPPGWRFVQGDISQAELRAAATASGDLELRRCFIENIDVHWRTLLHTLVSAGFGEYVEHLMRTSEELQPIRGKESRTVVDAADICLKAGPERCTKIWDGWKEGRKKAKAINFGFLYGMYENKFMETAKVKYGWYATFEEAHRAREAYFALYNELKRWHEKMKKLAKLNGYVRNLFGRLRRLPGITAKDKFVRMEAERQAINAPIQGFIGDYKAAVMIEVEEDIDHDHFQIVGEHHDAILGIVRIGCENIVLPKVLEIMRSPRLLKDFKIDLGLPMDGELEIGPWGNGEKYKEY